MKLDIHKWFEGSETFLLRLESGLSEASQKNSESVIKKDVRSLLESLKNVKDWSSHFETYEFNMVVDLDEDKRKDILIEKS